MKKPRRRVKIGDVIEVSTSKGLSYIQYTHEHREPPEYGSLVRILQGFYNTRPDNIEISHLVEKPHRFRVFFPLGSAVWQRIFFIVDNFPVPEFARPFPTFKNTNSLPNSNPEDAIWGLWDGQKSWRVGKLPVDEQMKYPELGVYNDTGLVHAIETGKFGNRTLC